MALTITGQKTSVNGPYNIGPGVNEVIICTSQNASVSSFSITSPFNTLFDARAEAFGSADTVNYKLMCTSTMNSSGQLSQAADNAVSFLKGSSAQQDIVILLRGC